MTRPGTNLRRSALAAAAAIACALLLGLAWEPEAHDQTTVRSPESRAPVARHASEPAQRSGSWPERPMGVPETPGERVTPSRPLRQPVSTPGVPDAEELYVLASDPTRVRENIDLFRAIASDDTLEIGLRRLALWGLAGAGELAPSIAALEGRGPAPVRVTAIEMLRRHGGPDAQALIEPVALDDRNPEVRTAALLALASLDPASAVMPLVEALDAPEALVRLDALEALGRLDCPEALGAVLDAPDAEPEMAWTRAAALFDLRRHDLERVACALRETATRGDLPPEILERVESLVQATARAAESIGCDTTH